MAKFDPERVIHHPEGLEFPIHGLGIDQPGEPDAVWHAPLLLTAPNITSVRRNHRMDWLDAREALPALARAKNGKQEGLTDDERDKLATLAILVDKGMFTEDRMVVVGERIEKPS